MTEHSSASIRQPKDWQDFERNSRILFECILEDIHVKNHGRNGQPQHGVDIYGRRNSQGSYIGVQCKGKDVGYGGQVTETELRAEVEKSRNFTPQISDFILVTTAPDDAAIEAVAREITAEREKEGNPLNVSIWGWGALEARISQYPKALEAFHPDATLFSGQILKNQQDSLANDSEIISRLNLLLDGQFSIKMDTTSAAMELLDKTLHAQIDRLRDLIQQGKPLTASDLLESLKSEVWETASDRIKFRIITNIGSAKLHISKEKEQEAICHFLEAVKYQPEDKIALANAILAYMLKGDISKAIAEAKAALIKNPENAEAASYLIQAHIKDETIDNPDYLVPETIRGSAPVDIAYINFYRMRDDARWIDAAKAAGERHPGNEHIIRFAAEAELDIALSTRGYLTGQRPVARVDMNALRRAASDLQKLWDKQYGSEIPYVDSSLPHNLAQTYRAVGDKAAAKAVIIQAIEKMPASSDLIKLRATFHLDDFEPEEALALLRRNGSDPECKLMSAEILLRSDPEAGLNDLENFERIYGFIDHHRIMAGELRVECLLSHPILSTEEKLTKAKDELNTLLQLFPENPMVPFMQSKIFEASGDNVAAKQALYKAKDLLKEDSIFYARFMLARRFEELDENADVADILDGYVDNTHDSPALRMVFFALINSDRRGLALSMLQSMPDSVKNLPAFLRATISLHFRRGDYSAAEDAISRVLTITPNDLHTHLNRADIWLRRREDESLKRFLSTPVEQLKGSSGERMRLAQLLDRYGYNQRALELGYKTHLEDPRNPQVQLAYVGLLLSPGSCSKANLQCSVIGPDSAFQIRNSSEETETFIVEEAESLRLFEEAVAPTHPFALAANGLKVDDTFSVNNEEWLIISVKHKYLHLLHSKMDRFDRHFPDHRGLQRLKLPKDEKGQESFEPMLHKIKERHDSNQEILNGYMEYPLPLEIFANFLGADVIEAWHGLALTGRKFKVCSGTFPERAEATRCIEENGETGCVVDALTLHIIRSLEIEDAVTAVCGPISMTESSIDTFRGRREQILLHGGRPFSTLYWKNGNYFREEITSKQLEQTLAKIDSELDWIDHNIDILPAESSEPISNEASRIRDALSYTFFDPVLAAQGAGRLLLCEDQSYRQFGRVEFNVRASWIQPVLMAALEQKAISQEKYCEAVCNLSDAGHSFTSIDSNILSYAFSKGEEKFTNASKALFVESADITSHLKVMLVFLHGIWNGKRPSLEEKTATSILLRRLFFGEWKRDDAIITAENVLRNIKHHRFSEYFAGWSKGHFLRPFDEKGQEFRSIRIKNKRKRKRTLA